jgi:hypothetical protein
VTVCAAEARAQWMQGSGRSAGQGRGAGQRLRAWLRLCAPEGHVSVGVRGVGGLPRACWVRHQGTLILQWQWQPGGSPVLDPSVAPPPPSAHALPCAGVSLADGLRGLPAGGGCQPGRGGADPGQRLPGAGERPGDHPSHQQNRPARWVDCWVRRAGAGRGAASAVPSACLGSSMYTYRHVRILCFPAPHVSHPTPPHPTPRAPQAPTPSA